jgi:hypothetical protein
MTDEIMNLRALVAVMWEKSPDAWFENLSAGTLLSPKKEPQRFSTMAVQKRRR